jgi:hypothetical protein
MDEPLAAKRTGHRLPYEYCGRTMEDASAHLVEFYIKSLAASVYPNAPLVLICRVSTDAQKENGNLAHQVSGLRANARKHSRNIIEIYEETASGKTGGNREQLRRAAKRAKDCNAILVAESTDRFIRTAHYTSRHQGAILRMKDLERLRRLTLGVPLATLIPPDTQWQQVRSRQTRRGLKFKSKGRRSRSLPEHHRSDRSDSICHQPWKARKLARQAEAKRLIAEGKSYRQASAILNQRKDRLPDQTHVTVRNWDRC